MNSLDQKENEKKVVVSPEDAKAAFEFWSQYEVPVMEGLKEAFEKFQAEPTWENQENLKFMVTKAISITDHEAFKDESFAKVHEQCSDTYYKMEFDRDFEATVSVDPSKEK